MSIILAALGVLFIGFSKAGFGGGLGMLTTPLCVLAFTARGKDATYAIGILLPDSVSVTSFLRDRELKLL